MTSTPLGIRRIDCSCVEARQIFRSFQLAACPPDAATTFSRRHTFWHARWDHNCLIRSRMLSLWIFYGSKFFIYYKRPILAFIRPSIEMQQVILSRLTYISTGMFHRLSTQHVNQTWVRSGSINLPLLIICFGSVHP